MKKVFLFLSLLLSLGLLSGCSKEESYISGTLQLFDHEVIGNYVFIGGLKMPEGDDRYNYIKTVVVPKEEFPLQSYKTGDAIYFNIIEVHGVFPQSIDIMHSPTNFLCSIKLYE